jgi:hypothetical protein
MGDGGLQQNLEVLANKTTFVLDYICRFDVRDVKAVGVGRC